MCAWGLSAQGCKGRRAKRREKKRSDLRQGPLPGVFIHLDSAPFTLLSSLFTLPKLLAATYAPHGDGVQFRCAGLEKGEV